MINLNQLQNLMQNRKPETAIILGSGLGSIADNLQNKLIIKYEEIEGFLKARLPDITGNLSSEKLIIKKYYVCRDVFTSTKVTTRKLLLK